MRCAGQTLKVAPRAQPPVLTLWCEFGRTRDSVPTKRIQHSGQAHAATSMGLCSMRHSNHLAGLFFLFCAGLKEASGFAGETHVARTASDP